MSRIRKLLGLAIGAVALYLLAGSSPQGLWRLVTTAVVGCDTRQNSDYAVSCLPGGGYRVVAAHDGRATNYDTPLALGQSAIITFTCSGAGLFCRPSQTIAVLREVDGIPVIACGRENAPVLDGLGTSLCGKGGGWYRNGVLWIDHDGIARMGGTLEVR